MEQTECSEMLAFKLQTPGNNPNANIRDTHRFTTLHFKFPNSKRKPNINKFLSFHALIAVKGVNPSGSEFPDPS
jgi:hypothetical protein